MMKSVRSFPVSGSTDPIKDPCMIFLKTVLRLVLIPVFLLTPAALLADTNCEEGTGPLNTAQPQGMTPQEIIQKFTAPAHPEPRGLRRLPQQNGLHHDHV